MTHITAQMMDFLLVGVFLVPPLLIVGLPIFFLVRFLLRLDTKEQQEIKKYPSLEAFKNEYARRDKEYEEWYKTASEKLSDLEKKARTGDLIAYRDYQANFVYIEQTKKNWEYERIRIWNLAHRYLQ